MVSLRKLGAIFLTLGMAAIVTLFMRTANTAPWSRALWLQGFLMLWAHLLMRTSPYRFPRSYYRHRRFEKQHPPGYRFFGVTLARRILRKILNGPYRNALATPDRRQRLVRLYQTMVEAETAHMLLWILEMLIVLFAAITRNWAFAGWLFLFNLLFNAYPVAVQRLNRRRLERILERRRGTIDWLQSPL